MDNQLETPKTPEEIVNGLLAEIFQIIKMDPTNGDKHGFTYTEENPTGGISNARSVSQVALEIYSYLDYIGPVQAMRMMSELSTAENYPKMTHQNYMLPLLTLYANLSTRIVDLNLTRALGEL